VNRSGAVRVQQAKRADTPGRRTLTSTAADPAIGVNAVLSEL